MKKLVFSLEREALLEENRDLALVLVRAYKNKNMSCIDILEHIPPYLCSVPFDFANIYNHGDYEEDYEDDSYSGKPAINYRRLLFSDHYESGYSSDGYSYGS